MGGCCKGVKAHEPEFAAWGEPQRPSQRGSKRMRSFILDSAASKYVDGLRLSFGILCVDQGKPWPDAVMRVETAAGIKYMARCPGLTREDLKEPVLEEKQLESIRNCYEELEMFAGPGTLKGISSDFGNLWLKHHSSVRKTIPEVPVYLTPIVQLPMISASFKSFEQTLLITWKLWETHEELQCTKCHWMDGCSMNIDMDRLDVLGVNCEEPMWKHFIDWQTTHAEDMELGKRLLKMAAEYIRSVNTAGKKDKLIKALLITSRLSVFSDVLREGTGLPVFDEQTMLSFFASGSGLSHYNDASVLTRLNRKLRPQSVKGNAIERGDAKLGLIQLEYDFPPAFGDVDHPGTFGFKVAARVVKGLLFEKAQMGVFNEEIETNMAKMIAELEAEGVVGITGNCGFMMHYQCFARYVARVPVFMSALIQAATMAAALEPDERVLILTANDATLQPGKDKLLLDSGINVTHSDRFVIRGCQDLPGFEAVANAERVDTIKVTQSVVRFVNDIIEKEGHRTDGMGPIKMILLECTELPHYADCLRNSTGLPTFDAVTCINFFYKATAVANWNTETYAPHNQAFWKKNYDGAGRRRSVI